MNDKIEALVLSINDYRENDLLIQVISKDKGFLSLTAKSAKKMSAKLKFVNLCKYEFIIDYKETKTIFSIHNAKLIDNYYEDNNLLLLSFKNILVELVLKNKELYSEEMYQVLNFCLKEITQTNMYLIGSLYLAYLLRINGLTPFVDGCVVCGNSKVVGISKNLGGFLCSNHLGQDETLEVSRLKKFRLINKATIDNYEAIKEIEFDLIDFKLMINFYLENSEVNLKSYRMFKELFA